MEDNSQSTKQQGTSNVHGQILACVGILIDIYSDFSKLKADEKTEIEHHTVDWM